MSIDFGVVSQRRRRRLRLYFPNQIIANVIFALESSINVNAIPYRVT